LLRKIKFCQLVINLLALSICVLSCPSWVSEFFCMSCLVHSFLEPFWIKDLCDPGRWQPWTGTEQRLKVRQALEMCTNRTRSNIKREMGQQVSKEKARFTEILCSMLCNRGCNVSWSQLKCFLSYVQECTRNCYNCFVFHCVSFVYVYDMTNLLETQNLIAMITVLLKTGTDSKHYS
jgi:hypothetical protein